MSEKEVMEQIENLIKGKTKKSRNTKKNTKKSFRTMNPVLSFNLFLKKVFSYLIDFMIFYFVFYFVFTLIFSSLTGMFSTSLNYSELNYYLENNTEFLTASLTSFFGGMCIFLFYLVLFEYYNNQTLGQKTMHLIVKTGEKRKNLHQLIIRNLTKTFLMPFLLIDLISVFFTNKNQRLTEIISNTYVEEERK